MSRSSVATCGKTIMDRPIPSERQYVASTAAEIPEIPAVQYKWKVENLRSFVEFSSEILQTESAEKYLTAAKLPFWDVSELIYDETKKINCEMMTNKLLNGVVETVC